MHTNAALPAHVVKQHLIYLMSVERGSGAQAKDGILMCVEDHLEPVFKKGYTSNLTYRWMRRAHLDTLKRSGKHLRPACFSECISGPLVSEMNYGSDPEC